MKHIFSFYKKHQELSKKIAIIVALCALVLLGYYVYVSGNIQNIVSFFQQGKQVKGIILFSGSGCSHCAKVDDFIKANHVTDKVAFTELEVLHDQENAAVLADRAQTCGLRSEDVGVPLLWDGEHCIVGDVDVISFFKSKLSAKTSKNLTP